MSASARSSSIPRCALRLAAALPARALLGLIWLYRRTFSPLLPAVFGPTCGCRFHPTCSQYAADAVRTHGALAGGWLALLRLLKCHPLHPGGFDPVPPARRRPICRSAPPRPDSAQASPLLATAPRPLATVPRTGHCRSRRGAVSAHVSAG